MRETLGGTWIMALVITFMLIFVAFLSITINYTKTFQMKNDILTILEEKEGATNEAIGLINNFLRKSNYKAKKPCSSGYGASDLSGNTLEKVENNKKEYYYCIERSYSGNNKTIYSVHLFLSFTLPILGDFSAFEISGQTMEIRFPNNSMV